MGEAPRLTVYDFLDDWLGERFTSDVAVRLGNIPPRQLDALHIAYEQWLPGLMPRPISPGELRPHVWNHFQSIGVFSSGLISAPDRDHFIRLLLTYAHGVTIPSELQVVFSRLTRGHGTPEELRATMGFALLNYASLRDLSEKGAVEWLEEPGVYLSPVDTAHEAVRLVADGDVWSWSELDLGPSASHGNAVLMVSQACAELTPTLEYVNRNISTLLLRHRFLERVFNLMLLDALGGATAPASKAPTVLESLIRIGVPSLDPPTWHDLFAIRENDATFFSWRTVLRDALTAATDMANDQDLPAVRSALAERLTPEAQRLSQSIRRSSALSTFSTGLTYFGISGVGSLVASALGADLLPALAGAATAGVVGGVVSHIGSSAARRADRALLTHYLTFAPQD